LHRRRPAIEAVFQTLFDNLAHCGLN
jgi:hypothetical protein